MVKKNLKNFGKKGCIIIKRMILCFQSKRYTANNTTKTKQTLIFERESGKCVFACSGTDSFPQIAEESKLLNCEEYGISLADLQEITDDRFDK